MDIGDPSCFPLLTRNCVMEVSLVRYRSVREGLRTRIFLRECEAAKRARDARRQPQRLKASVLGADAIDHRSRPEAFLFPA